MAVGDMALSVAKFANGVSKSIMPNTYKKSISKMSTNSAKELATSMAFKNGEAFGRGLLKNGVTNGTANTIKNMNEGMKFNKALKSAHTVNGKLSTGKMLGTFATVSVAGRVATGGGLYKDQNGNFNIPGLPFI